jgi:TonB family protein
MQPHRRLFRIAAPAILVISAITSTRLSAQDVMQSVKDLYASAAYEDALSAVGKIEAGGGASSLEAEQYRVFCLVALGRTDEAEQAVESVLTAHPEYRPDAAQASPRIQSLFSKVRQRIGPALVKRMYQQGRAAMERKERDEAVAQFESMLRIANDPDVRGDATISELKELGSGFLELSKALPAKTNAAEAAPTTAAASTTAAAAARSGVIVPPVVIQQRLPMWIPAQVSRATEFRGAVRVQISTEGKVVSAEIVRSVHPAYDQALLRAARTWLYEPAKKDGVAIPSEKTVEVAVAPPAPKAPAPADKSLPF